MLTLIWGGGGGGGGKGADCEKAADFPLTYFLINI